VTRLCEVLGLSTRGYCAWLKRGPSQRARADVGLSRRIGAVHEASRGTYGVPRVHAELRAEGTRVSRERGARLMRKRGIQGATRRKGVKTIRRGRDRHGIPDLLTRKSTAEALDRRPVVAMM
jgi:putative transposase